MSHIKEVETLKQDGLPEQAAVEIFQAITERFDEIHAQPELGEFRQELLDLRKHERKEFRKVIDDICDKVNTAATMPVKLNWRNVRYEPGHVKRCEVCGDYFYDVSRNGRKLTCDAKGVYYTFDLTNREYRYYHKNGTKLSVCATEYEKCSRTGSILYPVSKRNPNEVLFDPQPAKNDAQGHAIQNEVNETAW